MAGTTQLGDFALMKEREARVDKLFAKNVMWLIIRGDGREDKRFKNRKKFSEGK
jgi:hypothetical protein